MRTIFMFCSCLLLAFSAKGQITITSSSMPVSGDTIRYSIANPNNSVVNANLSIKGDSMSWDLSALGSNRQDMYSYKNSSLTPYGFYFFNKIGLKTADSLGTAMFTFKNIYSFYTKNSNVFKAEGLGYSYQNFPLAATYKDDDEIYKFPLDYHDSDVSTFYFEFALPVGNYFRYVQGGTRTNNVDGWGSVKTPYKTYPNVLRMKTIVDEVDTLITQFGSFPIPRRQVIYRWLSADEHIPVVEITGIEVGTTFVASQIIYRDRYRSNPLAPNAGFKLAKTQGNVNTDTFYFINTTRPSAATFTWQFAPAGVKFVKGTSAASRNPVVVFTKPGLYSVTLIAKSFMGTGDTTAVDLINIQTGATSGLNVKSFNIYPNPTGGRLYLAMDPDENFGTVEIYNNSGKLVYSNGYNGYSGIDLKSFSPGIYFIHINGFEPMQFIRN